MSRARGRVEEGVDAVFAALSSSTRREILEDLTQSGPATPSELGSRHGVSRQAISKHLGTLADAGLVRSARHGREVRYRATPEPLVGVVDWMTEVGASWDDRLERLTEALSSERP